MASYVFTAARGGVMADVAGDGSPLPWATGERAPDLETPGGPAVYRWTVSDAAAAKRLRAMAKDDPDGYQMTEVKNAGPGDGG